MDARRRDHDRCPKTPPRQTKLILPPLNAPIARVLMEIKNEEFVKWPEKIKINPLQRNKNKYCEFYRDHTKHKRLFLTKGALIKRGYLRKFVSDHLRPATPERTYINNKLTARDIQTIHGILGQEDVLHLRGRDMLEK
ncbi:hypothetical protein Acr_07g0013950 [Actinidia rufa]|uniref:Uncharacterized protein n=1 Tax=Actinidia rufa TaxID=165716 RepID=A0A7J0EZ00_9ERIC|nr:hypothetical protein Acr_07g0013950 [Actinidia rufa]